ncbi:hypothetical protein GCM10009819_36440 [Agromyces tropicus]|uniref:Uncharacterized protein n=1 Tax=Agromyces tropicus TaxID=555371 RepID=A0ABN2V3V6_9MICO
MERIHYAGGVLLTGTAIADAIVDYAAALATRQSAASVDIPVRLDDGSTARAHLLIGPASQLVTEPVSNDHGAELEDEELVGRLRSATGALSDIRPIADPSAVVADHTDDLEWPRFR